MNKIFLAGAALLSFSAVSGVAIAQDMGAPAAQPPAGGMAAPATDPAAPPPPADPNAGQSTGTAPTDPGMASAPAGAPNDPAAPMGSSASPGMSGGNMAPTPTETKNYPVCSKTVQDSCINRGDAGKMRKRR
ncbi:MAG: Fe-S oxidoreductase [Sphingobium sp.]|uniref:Fe-S oxidoreductase n=1 Tax=Sphingobium sp. TaxID=1912891 RepID=UPI000DB6A8B0|nr:Fe-S oxidoreductase [Sphingobium sp.]PZU12362.1 MAG: Fe-S oxidoreductase [Sphingobium sp.]